MEHDPQAGPGAEARTRLFDAFHALTAQEVMDPELCGAAFLPPHLPVFEALELFLERDHAWVLADPAQPRGVTSIVLRRDLLRALESPGASYSHFSRLRFHSLAHGSADCICCFTEGRVLHAVRPDTPCREVVRLLESKSASYLPVIDDERLVGEIGAADLLRALHRLYRRQAQGR